jgi:NAD dependent epimerase/dehydratase
MTMEAYFKGKKVLVTGAGGFIGSHLVEKLVALGADVQALVHYNALTSWGNLELIDPQARRQVDVRLGDVSDPFCIDALVKGKDLVFHLAALIGIPYSYIAPQQYVMVNVIGTVNVLEAAKRHGISKMVHTSTSETYGTALYTPIDEKHALQGQSPYSASKISADMMAESYHRSFGVPVAICRPFNTFGPRQSSRAVIPTMIIQLLNGKKDVKLGSLEPYRDFNYVSDTVRGFLAVGASEKSIGEVINVGTGRSVKVKEVWEILQRLTGMSAEVSREESRVRPVLSEVMKLEADATKARELVGWSSEVTLEEGLARAVEWYGRNLQRYNKADMYVV